MEINVKENGGLLRISFRDRVDNNCIIQAYKSTAIDEMVIRFGVISDAEEQESIPMSLTRDQLILLMPFLESFCRTGKLPFEFLGE